MSVVLASSSYGKSSVRLLKVAREGSSHEIRELTVDIALEGAFEAAHTIGDNSAVLPTDTMKNTVYAKARELPLGTPEDFARALAEHFLGASPAASGAHVSIREHGWRRLTVNDKPHDHAFERASNELRTVRVSLTRGGAPEFVAGIEELLVLKSGRSAFSGYPRDRYTTLRETEDRILSTSISTNWRYRADATDFDARFVAVRAALLETFADHDSKSVQHTLYAMGKAVLERCAEVEEISVTMPNKHHLLVDLAPLGLDNPNQIFVPTTEPYGLIEATLRRGL
jgi:urate oxidase